MILFAIDSRVTTALVISGALLLFGALLIVTAAGELRGRRIAKVPPAFRPAPSDEELERRVIERYLMWGALLTLLMALWLPALWIYEPTRQNTKKTAFANQAVVRGEEQYIALCVQCHGKEAVGGSTPYTIDGVAHTYAEPPLRYIYSRYQQAGRKDDEITQLIYDAINRGRPGTPMPTWGIAFGGPLISQQVDDLVAWIQKINTDPFPAAEVAGTTTAEGAEVFKANCAICHGAQGQGGIGPNLTVALERLTTKQLTETIQKGRLNTNRPSMPAWAGLGDDAVKALVAFLQSIQRG